ncbi:MAG: acyl dehydratase [Rhodospirillaceae bacterium]|nr:acyl dehydratase [Rhodospirillaceae bacterium]
MIGRHLEDYAEGEVIISRPYRLGRREILAFANAYDPQPMHIDEEFAVGDGPFRDIIASGFQTVALAFKLFAEAGFFDGDVALGGPGMDEVRWLAPVYPDDMLTNHITVVEVRRSKSKPDRGILRLGHDLRNQHDVSTVTCVTASMIRTRNTPVE